ncbi:superinfection immunity protein [Natranaerofaba carboxydovora]|uniref:superinfection immunity protein n=1 Tax=Natranaerofaba carboxydovora TaxID=2742683 RepID=UPI001F129F21|nr:superinfection immunity protein [Natranaerofaba carboxydovora]
MSVIINIFQVIFPLLVVFLYFVPSFMAKTENHADANLIILVNVLGSIGYILYNYTELILIPEAMPSILWIITFVWASLFRKKEELKTKQIVRRISIVVLVLGLLSYHFYSSNPQQQARSTVENYLSVLKNEQGLLRTLDYIAPSEPSITFDHKELEEELLIEVENYEFIKKLDTETKKETFDSLIGETKNYTSSNYRLSGLYETTDYKKFQEAVISDYGQKNILEKDDDNLKVKVTEQMAEDRMTDYLEYQFLYRIEGKQNAEEINGEYVFRVNNFHQDDRFRVVEMKEF